MENGRFEGLRCEDGESLNLSRPSTPLPEYSESTVPAYHHIKTYVDDVKDCEIAIQELQEALRDLPVFSDLHFRKAKGRQDKVDRSGRRECAPRPNPLGGPGGTSGDPNGRDSDGVNNNEGENSDGNRDNNGGSGGSNGGGDRGHEGGGGGDEEQGNGNGNGDDENNENEEAEEETAQPEVVSSQLPSQRRLSSMDNDVKKADFPREPDCPELRSLHRKLRIQKDRLVSWGLEWSDPSLLDIGDSLNKGVLSELVGSIITTIKDILAEAEPLWYSSKHAQAPREIWSNQNLFEKATASSWDQARFEDLVRDLTMSIDTLHDLSRIRQGDNQNPQPNSKSIPLSPVQPVWRVSDFDDPALIPRQKPEATTPEQLPRTPLEREKEKVAFLSHRAEVNYSPPSQTIYSADSPKEHNTAVLTASQLSYIEQSLMKAGLTNDVQGIMSSLKGVIRRANIAAI